MATCSASTPIRVVDASAIVTFSFALHVGESAEKEPRRQRRFDECVLEKWQPIWNQSTQILCSVLFCVVNIPLMSHVETRESRGDPRSHCLTEARARHTPLPKAGRTPAPVKTTNHGRCASSNAGRVGAARTDVDGLAREGRHVAADRQCAQCIRSSGRGHFSVRASDGVRDIERVHVGLRGVVAAVPTRSRGRNVD
jgi:hypothetical protein